MATREENIKKINDELEKLSDEELDHIAGGTAAESADDSRFLNSLNNSTDRYGEMRIRGGSHDNEITIAWAKLGVAAVLDSGGAFTNGDSNQYYINGQRVSQEQARQHAMKVTGHYMTEKDWKW